MIDPSERDLRSILSLTEEEYDRLVSVPVAETEGGRHAPSSTPAGHADPAARPGPCGATAGASGGAGAPATPEHLGRELLGANALGRNLSFCSVPTETQRYVLERISAIWKNREMRRLVGGLFQRVFHTDEKPADWPDVADRNDLLGIIYLVVGASMVPLVRRTHESLSVPVEVTRTTCRQVAGFCGNHETAHGGAPGILPRQLYWLRHYPAGRLFRLGRFEYMRASYSHSGPVYRRRDTGVVLAFAEDGAKLSADGRVLVRNEPELEEGAWTARIAEEDARVLGNPIHPEGIALRRRVSIDRSQWQCVIRPGSPVLDLHIPPGGGMYPEAARESFLSAFEFFDRHFPQHRATAVVCRSWIFNTQFEERLPETNLAKLMREVYLLPAFSSGTDGMFFVFCREYDRLEEYPQNTRLERAMISVLAEGERLRSTGMVLFREDLGRFGGRWYRGSWPVVQDAVGTERK